MRFSPPKILPCIPLPSHPSRSCTVYRFANFTDPIRRSLPHLSHTLHWSDQNKPTRHNNDYVPWKSINSLKQAHAVIPTLHMFSNTAEQTQLFNYLHSNINCSGNERLYALTAWQKCVLPGCSNTLHSTLCYSLNMAPYSHQMAWASTCHSYTGCHLPSKWGGKQIWEKEAKIIQYMWCSFFLCALLLLPFDLWREGRKAKKKDKTYIAFDCIRRYLCALNLSPLL